MPDTSVNFGPVEIQPAYRTAANLVEQRILKGEIRPGQALPSEIDLARQLGVNRSTVREALRALEQVGLVRRTSGRRLVASIPREGDLATRLSRAMVMHQITFLELCETMMALEPLAAELAAMRVEASDLSRLDQNLRQTRDCLDNRESLVALDVEFHLIISQAAGNRALMLAREPVGMLFYPTFYLVMSRLNAGERLLVAHQAIVTALRNRAPPEARQWMLRHIIDFKRGFELANLDIGSPIDTYGHL